MPGGFEAGGAVSNPHTLMSMADAALHRRPSQSGGFAPGGTTRSSRGYDGLESAQGHQGDGRPHSEAGGLVHRLVSTTRHGCAGDGRPHFDIGGAGLHRAADQPLGLDRANAMVQQLYQCYANADLAQLARLSVMYPPTSIEGQIIRRVLMAKRMALAAKAPLPERPGNFGLGATQANLTSQMRGGFAPISGAARGFEAGGAVSNPHTLLSMAEAAALGRRFGGLDKPMGL